MSLFCKQCGSILIPKKTEAKNGDENAEKAKCSKCGYAADDINTKITEKVSNEQKIDIIEKKEDILPKTSAECPKCGNRTAGYWLVQTRAGDEPETKFLRCTKCEHTWRDYS